MRCKGHYGIGVHFPPQTEILDRTHLIAGDNVIFGHRVFVCAHVIAKKEGKTWLTLKPVTIKRNASIGGFSILGPDVVVHEGAQVAYGTQFMPNEEQTSPPPSSVGEMSLF